MVWPLIANGALKRADDPLGDALQHRVVGRDGGDDGEFVAAEPRHEVLGRAGCRERRSVTLRISSSPTGWPSVSLTSLKWSRSM